MSLGLMNRYISGTGSVVDSGKHKGNQTMLYIIATIAIALIFAGFIINLSESK
jgi:hypothetical protein